MAEVLRAAMRVVGLGLMAGVVAAQLLGELLVSLVIGARQLSPSMVVIVAGSFLLVALFAAAVPALRVARIDPLLAIQRVRT